MSPTSPSKPEAEYFTRLEIEKKRKVADEQRERLDELSHQRLKEEHWMRCPKCGFELQTIAYRGIVMDKCFACQGVFLDDGELEKVAGEENGFLPGLLSLFKL